MENKIYDCVTFFQENFITNIRFEILDKAVDYFVVCESQYDHRGNKKKLNFKLTNPKFKEKLIYIVHEKPFKNKNEIWKNQAQQRDYIISNLSQAEANDYIMFSDPDEIPRPELLKNILLKKKYGIFLQSMYCYKFNLFNKYESPWEGTRICKKKNLKSIDYMRQQIKLKNLSAPFWKFYKEKSIQIIENGGWHFNSLSSPEEISKKLKTFAHNEFSSEKFSSINIIKEKMINRVDLFERGHEYEIVKINNSYPNYLIQNINKFKEFICS
ncbi:glycosyl transferase family 17 [Pelagibacterales bacterium SAG-MED20]|nr:glycosyl transferase family 17 [Pelagibacterales bacterium SAG-MED20]